jgi:hypothetical protein
MGTIVVTEFVSLDGAMEDPGGSEGSERGAWTFEFDREEEGNKFKLDELRGAEAEPEVIVSAVSDYVSARVKVTCVTPLGEEVASTS